MAGQYFFKVDDKFLPLSGGTVTGNTYIQAILSADTLNLVNTPTNDDSLIQILGRNSSTGDIEYRDVQSIISAATSQDTYVTGFTYDNINTFSISDNSGTTFNASIDELSATTISATTYYGDGSMLSGITTDNFYVSGGTYNEGTTSIDFSGNSVETTFNVSLSGISSNIDIYNTYFVSPTGDDSTAVRGDLHNPFKTITAARNTVVAELSASTVTGDTLIYVYPGNYTDQEVQYENGNFYFTPNTVVTLVQNTTANRTDVFRLGASLVNTPNIYSANTCNVYGQAKFIVSASTSGGLGGGVIQMFGNAKSHFECDSAYGGKGTLFSTFGNSELKLKANELELETNDYVLTFRESSKTFIDVNRIKGGTGGWAVYYFGFNGQSILNVDELVGGTTFQPLGLQSVSDGAEIVLNINKLAHEPDAGTQWLINNTFQSGGKITYNGNMNGTANGIIYGGIASGGEFNYNGDILVANTAIFQAFPGVSSTDHKFNFNGTISVSGNSTTPTLFNGGTITLNGSLLDLGGTGTNGISTTSSTDLRVDNFRVEGVTTNSIIGSGNVDIFNSLYIDKPIGGTVTTTGQYTFTGTTYDGDLNIYNTPTNDNSLTEILGRNSTTGDVEYRDVSSIIGAASADTYVTAFTYDNANKFTINDNSGSTFNAVINTVTGLTSSGNIDILGNVIVTGGTGNVFSKQYYVEGNLGLDWDFGNNAITLGNPVDGVIINGNNLTVNSDVQFNSGVTVDGNTLIKGNVTILGSATTIDSETVLVKDNIITINSNATGSTAPFPIDSGIEVLRNSGTTASLVWEESNEYWSAGLTGSTARIILEGDGLNLLNSGHTHPISEIIDLQTELDKKFDITGGTVTGDIIATGAVSADTLSLTSLPNLNNSATDILVRNLSTGTVDYRTVSSLNDITRVQSGTNTFTGGTANNPTVNVTGLTVDNISISGISDFQSISATTIYSGSTDLYDIFLTTEDGNGIFDASNSGGTVPSLFGYTLTDSIQQNAANSYVKHEDREFAMVGTALGDRSYSISRSLANTTGNGSVFMLNNAGLTDNDRIDFLLQNYSNGASSKTELNFRRSNIGPGSGGKWIDFIMQSGINQNLYFNYNTNGSVPYGNVIVQNGNFVINNLGTGTSVTNLGWDVNGFVVSASSDSNTFVTGFTYNDNNTFTIFDNDGAEFPATINQVSGLTVSGALSAVTISGGTLYSGSTDLYDIFLTENDGNDITRVQGGTNINTGGTANNPIVNLDDDISLNSVSADTLSLTSLPNLNNSATDILVRNSSTGEVEYKDTGTFSAQTIYNSNSIVGSQRKVGLTDLISFSGGTVDFVRTSSSDIFNNYYFNTSLKIKDYLVSGGGAREMIDSGGSSFYYINQNYGMFNIPILIGASGTPTAGVDLDVKGDALIDGGLTINGDLDVNGQSTFSGTGTDVLQIYGSGSTSPLFRVEGSSGELFSISDSLIGELFAVNDISGIPILQVHSDSRIILGDYAAPSLYTTAKATATAGSLTSIYSVPLSAYTGAWFEYTAKGTTSLRAGNIASIFSGTSINHNETTTTDIGDTSDLLLDVIISGTNATLTASATTSNWEIKTIIRSI